MKVHSREALCDLLFPPVTEQFYSQDLQANLLQLRASVFYYDIPPTPMDTSSYSNGSAFTHAAFIEMANNVQHHEAILYTRENQMMTQFQEMMTPLKMDNSVKRLMLPTTNEWWKQAEQEQAQQQ